MLCKPIPAQQDQQGQQDQQAYQGSGWRRAGLSDRQISGIVIAAVGIFLILCCCLGSKR